MRCSKHAVTTLANHSSNRFSTVQLKQKLKSTDIMSQHISNTKTLKFKIPANGLLDFSVTSSPIQFKMTQGKDAEIHGYPLKKHKNYTINEGGVGIYSWKGCKLEVSGFFTKNTQPILIKDDDKQTPIKHYLMAHSKLYKLRAKLSKIKTDFKCLNYNDLIQGTWSDFDIHRTFLANLDIMGPRMLILGPVNTGKSTLCKSLINWAQRLNDEPIYIDLDCGQNSLSIPGTIAGDIVNDYHIPWKCYENNECVGNPFIYYFGNISPTHYEVLYKHYVAVIAMTMKKKMLSFDKQRSSGCIINTCGFIDGPLALSVIKHIIKHFCVNYIIVMEHAEKDKLLTFLHGVNKEVKHNIHICDLPVAKSVKLRAQNERYIDRQKMCKQYFFGDKILKNTCFSENEVDGDDEKKHVMNMHEFIDEYQPFERTYLFNELTVYEVLRIFNHEDSCSSSSYSSSSDKESNERGKKSKMNKKRGGNKAHKVLDVAYKYCDGLGGNNFKIKSKRFEESMAGNIIAVTHAQSIKELLVSNVAGFIYIKDIDKEKKELTVLQSCVGPLPGLCLFGRVKWDTNC